MSTVYCSRNSSWERRPRLTPSLGSAASYLAKGDNKEEKVLGFLCLGKGHRAAEEMGLKQNLSVRLPKPLRAASDSRRVMLPIQSEVQYEPLGAGSCARQVLGRKPQTGGCSGPLHPRTRTGICSLGPQSLQSGPASKRMGGCV